MPYPLQTRTCFLTPDRMDSPDQIERTLGEYADRGYNAVIVPVLWEGRTYFRTHRDGRLRDGECVGRGALEQLRSFNFSVLLGVDLLTAGEAGSDHFGSLARGHGHWLMKNIEGQYKINQFPEFPGMFCWSTTDYRRFLGNLLVDITDAYPVDGMVLDLRYLPRTTPDPRTWTHLGFSSLQRIEAEMGINLEGFLRHPTMESLKAIESWRAKQLVHFIESLKARVQKMRGNFLTAMIAGIGSAEDPYAPWIKTYDEGTVDVLLLAAQPWELKDHLDAIDSMMGERRPYQVVSETEQGLEALGGVLKTLSPTGYCVLKPDPLQRVLLGPAELEWTEPGAVEVHPLLAIRAIVAALAERAQNTKKLGSFLSKLQEYLAQFGETLTFEDAMKVRRDIIRIQKRLRDEDSHLSFDTMVVERYLDLVARLFLLTPVPHLEY